LVVVIQDYKNPLIYMRADWRPTMASPRNASLSGERAIETVLALLEQHEVRLRQIVESDDTTPAEKYEALMRLASLTGILTSAANG
jgi:hypothetical protein